MYCTLVRCEHLCRSIDPHKMAESCRNTKLRNVCGNKMPTRCNSGFYCRSYYLLNMFRASLCPSSGAQEYYTVVTACGISCCKNVKDNFVSFCGICVLSLKCRVLSRFVTRFVECRGGCVWVFLVGFFCSVLV